MPLTVTTLYAAVLALFVIVLANVVSWHRGRTGISILHGDDMPLALAMRRHGNLIENVPLALVLMALCEMRGLEPLWLHAAGSTIVAGRLAHALGLSVTNSRAPLRLLGGALTQLPMMAMIGYLVWSLF